MELFTLRHKKTKRLAGFESQAVDNADMSVGVEFELTQMWDNERGMVWVTTDREIAERVANTDTPWYNADVTSPQNSCAGEWEVVPLTFG